MADDPRDIVRFHDYLDAERLKEASGRLAKAEAESKAAEDLRQASEAKERAAAALLAAQRAAGTGSGLRKGGGQMKPSGKTLARLVREATRDNADQVEFFTQLANGEIDGATVRDRAEAHKWLADRGAGKAPEIVANVDLKENPFEDLTTEELRELAKKPTGSG